MPALPSTLALDLSIGPTIAAGEHTSNYTAIQTAVNAIITAFSAGASATPFVNGVGTAISFVASPTPSFATSLPTPTDGGEVVLTDSIVAPTYMWRLRYIAAAAKWYPQAGSWGYGTTLPTPPALVDKVEFTLVDSITLPTYQWTFRYNLGSSNADKWEFVGGAPVGISGAPSAVMNTGTQVAATGYYWFAGMSFTAPRAGVYDVRCSAQFDPNGSASTFTLALFNAGTAEVNSSRRDATPTATQLLVMATEARVTGVAASALIGSAGSGVVGTQRIIRVNLAVTPVRVS